MFLYSHLAHLQTYSTTVFAGTVRSSNMVGRVTYHLRPLANTQQLNMLQIYQLGNGDNWDFLRPPRLLSYV